MKYKPENFLLYGIMIYIILLAIGPYNYYIKNYLALLYLLFSFFLLFIGIKSAKIKVLKKSIKFYNFKSMSINAEKVLILIEIFAIICFCYYLLSVSSAIELNSNSGTMEGDFRTNATNISLLAKIANIGSHASIGVFIIVENTFSVKSKLLIRLSKVLFWLPAVSSIMIGARWLTLVSIILFFVVQRCSLDTYKRKHSKNYFYYVVAIALIIIALNLFLVRGVSNYATSYMPYYGQIEIKSLYKNLNISTYGYGKALYNLFYYFTHSVPYFLTIFDKVDYNVHFYGFYFARIFGFFFKSLPQYQDIVATQPCLNGTYSTFITGYFYDFGLFGSLLMIFFSGRFFGWVQQNCYRSIFLQFIRPIILTMSLLAPIYYFWHVASMDFIIFTLIIEYIIVKFFNKITTCK